MFLITFVVAMPVLALPPVARRIDELLYGPPPADFGRPPAPPPPTPVIEARPPKSDGISQAAYQEASPVGDALAASYVKNDSPPLLAPTPQFEPLAPPPASPAGEPIVDEHKIAALQQIRARLEQLGADYVVVEVQDGGRFRFQCRMLVDERSRFTRPFEASGFDPVAAGEEVLRAVEGWRAAGSAGR
jgi:hypothetical protein